jgi:CRP-like cAMP-binding protein
MVSPELLRRYDLFGGLNQEPLNAIAMLTEELTVGRGETIFEDGQPADALYLLVKGCLDLHYVAVDEITPSLRKELFVSEINPGELFGISAMMEPYRYQGTVRASCPSQVLRIDAKGLRALGQLDPKIGAVLMNGVAKATLARLHDTRILLAAAHAKT